MITVFHKMVIEPVAAGDGGAVDPNSEHKVVVPFNTPYGPQNMELFKGSHEQCEEYIGRANERCIPVSDIRNKLGPIKNLIRLIENQLVDVYVPGKDLIYKEIEQCKENIKYLTD